MRDEARRFDCTTCALRQQQVGLWRVNAEAWRIHQLLSGRTVNACALQGSLLERLTAGWTIDDVLDLVKRLDLISDVLEKQT